MVQNECKIAVDWTHCPKLFPYEHRFHHIKTFVYDESSRNCMICSKKVTHDEIRNVSWKP